MEDLGLHQAKRCDLIIDRWISPAVDEKEKSRGHVRRKRGERTQRLKKFKVKSMENRREPRGAGRAYRTWA